MHYQAALDLEPGRVDAREMITRAYWGQGRYAEAQGMMRSMGNLAGVAQMSGNRDTMARLAPVLAASSENHTVMKAAAMYVRLGRRDEAFDLLDQLHRRRYNHLPLTLRQQPFLSLSADPRYGRLLAKLGLK
jgi:thioredoxin-like negative regulator of GroEL